MTIAIIESGMTFGFYPAGHCFCIESCETVKKINEKAKKDEGVKIAEFLLLEIKHDLPKIFIIEAKTNPPPNDAQQRLIDFVADIRQKFSNSLALFVAIYLKRHEDSALSSHFKQLELFNVNFILILVIKNCSKAQAQKIQEFLQKNLKQTIKIWNLSLNPKAPSIIVLNEQKAKKLGLIYQSEFNN